jgi:AbrB family looped-hinge helix DNA binding protein
MGLIRSHYVVPDMETTSETTVNDRGGTTIPSEIRESLDIASGDKIRWSVTDDGTLSVEVVKQETGVFDDSEPASMGGDGAVEHNTTGAER